MKIQKLVSKKLKTILSKSQYNQLKNLGIDFGNPEAISQLLTKWNVAIHTDQTENFRQYMQKPFTGREIGGEYVDGHNYAELLTLDCMRLEFENLLNAQVEELIDIRTEVILQKLDEHIKWKYKR